MSFLMEKSADPQPVLWSKSQYHQMGEMDWFEGINVELIDGEIIQMSPISSPHWKSVILTGAALRRIFGDGYTVAEQNAFDGGPRSEPQPDVAVYAGGVRDFEAIPGHALLIVEISAHDPSVRPDPQSPPLRRRWCRRLLDRQSGRTGSRSPSSALSSNRPVRRSPHSERRCLPLPAGGS